MEIDYTQLTADDLNQMRDAVEAELQRRHTLEHVPADVASFIQQYAAAGGLEQPIRDALDSVLMEAYPSVSPPA